MSILRFSGFTLDPAAGALTGPEGPLHLRPKTLALLELLARHAGRPLSKENLLDAVWPDVTVTEETLTQTIHDLRRALGDAGAALIRTIPRRGYALEADVAPSAPAVPSRTSLSVTPFANLSSEAEHQFFADGLTTDLEAALGLIAEIDVLPMRDGASAARYQLSGTVRAAGDALRVTTRLTDQSTGRALWNGRYDGARTDIFAFQDQITRSVAIALQVELTTGDFARLWDGRTSSLPAWEKMVAARACYVKWTEAGNRRARHLLEQALELDPDYTGARVLLAKTWWYEARFFPSMDRALVLDEAERIARDITLRDPAAGGGWMVLGGVAWLRDRHDEALEFCRRACTLAPDDAWAHGFLGIISVFAGEERAALGILDTAARVAPLPWDWIQFHKSHARLWLGDLGLALDFAETYRALAPDDPWALFLLALVHGLAGRTEAAGATVAELLSGPQPLRLYDLRLSQRHRDPRRTDRVLRTLAAAGMPE